MALQDWLRPPRHLVALFLLLTLVPSCLLIAFGWRLVRQDLEIERQQAEAGREQAADVIVAALDQHVSAVEAAMDDAARLASIATPDGAVAVVFSRDGVNAVPQGRLLFYPVTSPGVEAPDSVFADGEHTEFRDRDPARAADWFRRLARQSSQPVRAGALIRLARNLRKAGKIDAALDAYAQIGAAGAAVGGVPADLLARWARCGLLESAGRSGELADEGHRLTADLLGSRWRLDRAQFDLHFADASRWAGGVVHPSADAIALATAVDRLYRQWRRTAPGDRFSGRAADPIDGMLMTRLWQGTAEHATGLVAAPGYVEAQWMARLASLTQRHRVRASVGDPAVRAPSTSAAAKRRSATETGLPWTVIIEGVGAGPSRFSGRRAIWLALLGVIGLLVGSGTYVVGRAVSRELAVARLQSDFVSAVSHEFRTPLTSLRQLSEMLIDHPGLHDSQRQTYYTALARQTERLHRLVESLLDFGRMEAGTSPYRLAPLDPGALVADVVRQFTADNTGRSVDIRLEGPPAAAVISADRDALNNALWNLLDNAVKYSPGSPVVWVEVTAEDSTLSIVVRDRGLGIPAEEQREIFDKFVRGATARAGNIRGTGLGLAMVMHIVKAHGGSVSVQSTPGEGSIFTMAFPLIPAPASATSETECLES